MIARRSARPLALLSFGFVAACVQSTETVQRADQTVQIRHQVTVIEGIGWLFEADGNFFGHDISPIAGITDDGEIVHQFVPSPGIILDTNTYALTIDSVLFKLENRADLDDVNPRAVVKLIEVAESYCEEIGYIRQSDGAVIHLGSTQTNLVEFCVPPDVTLPPFGRAGDRVPR